MWRKTFPHFFEDFLACFSRKALDTKTPIEFKEMKKYKTANFQECLLQV
jgi:hypothetical protein